MPERAFTVRFIPIALLLVVTAAVYLRVCGHQFIAYDDPIHVYENPYVNRGTGADFLHFWTTPHERLYIPLTYNLWTALAKVARWFPPDARGRLNPGVFHTANLLLHLLNTLLVYLILLRLIKESRAAVVGALLFALHPVQVEPVAWVSGLKDLLSAFWGLLALNQYLRACETAASGRERRRHYLLATVFFLLALLAKPSGMVIIGSAALAGYLLLNRPRPRLLQEMAPWCLLALGAILLTRLSQAQTSDYFNPLPWQRFLIAGDAVTFYLGQILLPLSLGLDYGRAPQFVLGQGWVWATGVAPYLLAGLLLWRASRTWLFAAGVFLVGLAPTLGCISFDFQRFSTVADRYLYLAMLGPAFAAGLLFGTCRHKAARMGLVGLLLVLGLKSFAQAGYWQNGFSLYEEALRVNQTSWLAHNNLGLEYLRDDQPEKSLEFFRQAIQDRPLNAKSYNNLANALLALNRPGEAIAYLQKALELAPNSPLIAFNLGAAYRQTGALPEALAAFQRAATLKPDFAEAHGEIGNIHNLLGQPGEAEKDFARAKALLPSS
jgi:tetratricopeptide (TPR) repeat protein